MCTERNQRYYATISLNNESLRTLCISSEGHTASSKSERCPSAKMLQKRGHMAAVSRSVSFRLTRMQGPRFRKIALFLPIFLSLPSRFGPFPSPPPFVLRDTSSIRANNQIIIIAGRESPSFSVTVCFVVAKVAQSPRSNWDFTPRCDQLHRRIVYGNSVNVSQYCARKLGYPLYWKGVLISYFNI